MHVIIGMYSKCDDVVCVGCTLRLSSGLPQILLYVTTLLWFQLRLIATRKFHASGSLELCIQVHCLWLASDVTCGSISYYSVSTLVYMHPGIIKGVSISLICMCASMCVCMPVCVCVYVCKERKGGSDVH